MKRAWTRWSPVISRWGTLACMSVAAALPGCGPADLPVEDAHDVVDENPPARAYAPPPPAYYPAPAHYAPPAYYPAPAHYPSPASPTIIIVQCPATAGPSCPVAAPPPVMVAPALPAVVFPPRIVASPAVEDPRIRNTVRANYGKFQRCYEKGLQRNPSLQGRVVVRLKIDPDGEVDTVRDHGSTMPDRRVVKCILDVYDDIEFPESYGITAVYPLDFSPRR